MNIFSGLESDYKGTIAVDGFDVRKEWATCREKLVILSRENQWPQDISAGEMVSFFKRTVDISEDDFEELYVKLNMEQIHSRRINELQDMEWRNILFSLLRLKQCKNYIFHEFAANMPLAFSLEFKKNLQRLKESACSILYLSGDVFVAPEIGDRIGFMKKGKLLLELKASRMRKMNLKELYFQFMVDD